LPEGDYQFKVGGLQKYDEIGGVQKALGAVGAGQWPGGQRSWGRYRFWLTPAPGTETFARSGSQFMADPRQDRQAVSI
jgi:hypothetical protein